MAEKAAWTESKTRRVLKRLMDGGLAVRSGRGLYAPDFRHDLAQSFAIISQAILL
jgi:hypothetical protein